MSTDLKYLAFTAILTATLWIPYVIAQVTTNGPLKPQNYVDPTPRPLPLWGNFWLRLAHAAVYLLGIPLVRTLIFTLGYVTIVGMFWELIK